MRPHRETQPRKGQKKCFFKRASWLGEHSLLPNDTYLHFCTHTRMYARTYWRRDRALLFACLAYDTP